MLLAGMYLCLCLSQQDAVWFMLSCFGISGSCLLPCSWAGAVTYAWCQAAIRRTAFVSHISHGPSPWHGRAVAGWRAPCLAEQCECCQVSARLDSVASQGSQGSRPVSSRQLSLRQFTRTISHAASRRSSSMAHLLHTSRHSMCHPAPFYCTTLLWLHLACFVPLLTSNSVPNGLLNDLLREQNARFPASAQYDNGSGSAHLLIERC